MCFYVKNWEIVFICLLLSAMFFFLLLTRLRYRHDHPAHPPHHGSAQRTLPAGAANPRGPRPPGLAAPIFQELDLTNRNLLFEAAKAKKTCFSADLYLHLVGFDLRSEKQKS